MKRFLLSVVMLFLVCGFVGDVKAMKLLQEPVGAELKRCPVCKKKYLLEPLMTHASLAGDPSNIDYHLNLLFFPHYKSCPHCLYTDMVDVYDRRVLHRRTNEKYIPMRPLTGKDRRTIHQMLGKGRFLIYG